MATIVVYGGGFQPFHVGHLSSYLQAKKAFPDAAFYVAASNDTKQRPIPFQDKQFLAQQAGVKDPMVETRNPINPVEILSKYNPERDVYIIVRSERDPMPYTKKDGTPAYYQPYVLGEPMEPFGKHGYVFVTKKHTFMVGGQEIYSGTQVRNMYSSADDKGRMALIHELYPNSKQQQTIKKMLDKYLAAPTETPAVKVSSPINKLKQKKLAEQIAKIRPLLKEASPDKKLKMAKMLKSMMLEYRIIQPTSRVNLYYISPKTGNSHVLAHNIPYSAVDKYMHLLAQKGYDFKSSDIEARLTNNDQYIRSPQVGTKEMAEGDVEEGMLGFLTKPKPVVKKPLDYAAVRQAARTSEPQKQVFRSPEEFAKSKQPEMAEGSEEALQYATQAHAGQTRSGGDPYISHPVRVANHIKQYKQSHNLDALISAAYLHDTIEDTDTTQEVLHDLFGGLVASLVKELTSDPEQIKKMGKAAYLSHKMAVMSSYGLVIKLADRLDNVKDITTAKTPEWRQKYAKETNQILDYIEKTRALSGTHKKLISLIRAKLAEIDNPPQAPQAATEGISRRGILKGIAGAGALGAAGKASAIAGAFPTPSAQQAMYKKAADSNAAQARADAAAKAKADAERLKTNTGDVERLNKVSYHGGKVTPTDASWDGDSDFLDMDGTKFNMAARMPISGDEPSDMKLISTREGRQVYIWTRKSLKGTHGRYFYPAPNSAPTNEDYIDEK